MSIKIDNYMCPNCFIPKAYNPQNNKQSHICSRCGIEMEFWCSEQINPETGKTIKNENTLQDIDIKKIITGKPTISCPYCQSTNTKKISGLSKAGSVAVWGIFALGKTTKQWHCNQCNSDF